MEMGTFWADTHVRANPQAAPAPPKQPPYNFSCSGVDGSESPPSLDGESHSTLCPHRMQVPRGAWLLPLSPHRIPQTQDNSNRKTQRILDTYHAQASKRITSLSPDHHGTFRDGWYYRSHFTNEETKTDRLRLPGLGLLLGLARGRPQQEVEGRKRDGAFWSLAGLCAPAGCLAAPPTAPGPCSFKKLHLAHSFRSRDRNAPLYCWPC